MEAFFHAKETGTGQFRPGSGGRKRLQLVQKRNQHIFIHLRIRTGEPGFQKGTVMIHIERGRDCIIERKPQEKQNLRDDRPIIERTTGRATPVKMHRWPAILTGFVLMIGLIWTAQAEKQQEASFDKIGSIVTFGRYEQDGDEENGPEAVEGIVLDVRDGKSLLLSRYGLDARPYHTENRKITWEECSLRKWLNSDFMQVAFTPEEQESIPETEVDNSRSQCFKRWKKAKGGKDTTDRVFLLSYAEANRYLGVSWYGDGSDKARMELTEYAIQKGAGYHTPRFEDDDGRTYWHWWLRSPGYKQDDASDVTTSGSLVTSGVTSEFPFVRPALWVDLNSVMK